MIGDGDGGLGISLIIQTGLLLVGFASIIVPLHMENRKKQLDQQRSLYDIQNQLTYHDRRVRKTSRGLKRLEAHLLSGFTDVAKRDGLRNQK